MKNILITGTNIYSRNSLSSWLTRYPDDYSIDTISLRDNAWKAKDFSYYDVVFHVAGIAHVSSDPNMEEEYYRVNRDLTIETAEKAKRDVAEQFIFMTVL